MNITARITPVRCHKTYNGTGQNGDYIIGSWIVKGVVDGKEFTVDAFTENHNYLLANPTLTMDCEIEISGNAWQDKFFNKLSLKSIIKPEGSQDVPSELPPVSSGIDPAPFGGIDPNDTGLPF